MWKKYIKTLKTYKKTKKLIKSKKKRDLVKISWSGYPLIVLLLPGWGMEVLNLMHTPLT